MVVISHVLVSGEERDSVGEGVGTVRVDGISEVWVVS